MGYAELPVLAVTSEVMGAINARVRSVLASLPAQRATAEALSPSFDKTTAAPSPSWLLLPIWLEEGWRAERSRGMDREVLGEILWGQYALFLYVRIQDDIMDGQRNDLRLLFAADRFLLESLTTFHSLAKLNEEFWTFYLNCLRETVDGILEVHRLETEPGRFGVHDLPVHGRVGAIFRIGMAAVCHLHGRAADVRWLSALLDLAAVSSQIRDDVQDLAQDLKVGRFTWVANTLLHMRPGETITPSEVNTRLDDGLMHSERGLVVVDKLRQLARAAAAVLPPSAPQPVHSFVEALRNQPGHLEMIMHQARVRHVFGELMPGG